MKSQNFLSKEKIEKNCRLTKPCYSGSNIKWITVTHEKLVTISTFQNEEYRYKSDKELQRLGRKFGKLTSSWLDTLSMVIA